MDKPRKVWVKPVLIVIGRGEPEERVLAGCKQGGGTGPLTTTTNCSQNTCLSSHFS